VLTRAVSAAAMSTGISLGNCGSSGSLSRPALSSVEPRLSSMIESTVSRGLVDFGSEGESGNSRGGFDDSRWTSVSVRNRLGVRHER